jgi:two-component system, sensor histidine kinase and response regulator
VGLSERRILIVDDDGPNRKLLRVLLQPLGCELIEASNGADAIRAFEERGADLVLLDVMMPDLDGIEVLKRLRERPAAVAVPVVLITASGEPDARLRGATAGADEFLEKPVDSAVLIARVKNLLRLREAMESLAEQNERLREIKTEQEQLFHLLVHDLKNPISVVQANLEFVREATAQLDRDLGEALEDAKEAAARVQHMVEDILLLSKLERAELVVTKRKLPLLALFEQVRRAQSREADRRGIRIEIAELDAQLSCSVDPPLLRRAVENIVESALRRTTRGGTVRLEAESGEQVEIRIANDGPSIPEEDRLRIFDKTGVGRERARALGSVGVALHLCKRAVEAHGGEITVVETAKWPTVFVVRLPSSS